MADIKFRDTAHRDFFLEKYDEMQSERLLSQGIFLCDGYRFGNEGRTSTR